jgi:spore coat polysaccharide biosynthesis predicted glycosyltransferase SpsG
VLAVRVVLGPGFSKDYRDRLKDLAQLADHKFEWLDAPTVLASAMLWCDVAVATSGVTKYELAATGTPAILLSPDAMHVEVNRPFAALGTCADLGLAKVVSPSVLAVEIAALLDDAERRKRMSRAGKLAVDGCGATRIAQMLKELAGAEV